jgi:very-short-patch-repair endonuclease
MFQCKRCKKDFAKYESLRKHTSRIHKISSEQFYKEFYLNGKEPKPVYCKCSCGNITTYKGLGKWYDYRPGHVARIHNNWGHNQKAIDASSITRRKQFESGERIIWNKGLTIDDPRIAAGSLKMNTPERALKISKALSGKKHSDEHTKNWKKVMQKYWNDPKFRKKLSKSRSEYMRNYLYNKPTLLEVKFKKLLDDLQISYTFQKTISNLNYDFLINGTNILIEVDGNWYHCNQNLNIRPTYEIQKHTIEHDLLKNKVALDNNYKLLRFWEHDINNNPMMVVKQLLDVLESQKT